MAKIEQTNLATGSHWTVGDKTCKSERVSLRFIKCVSEPGYRYATFECGIGLAAASYSLALLCSWKRAFETVLKTHKSDREREGLR